MQVSLGSARLAAEYGALVEKKSLDAQKAQGEAAVALIEATPTPAAIGTEGQGTHINTVA